MREISLEERKKLQLDMLVKIHDICQDNGWRYYMSSGTLLGAVRHKGYIPWDDDIDIMMPRFDYEQLCAFFSSRDKDENIRLISYRDKTSIYPFAKMVDSRTIVFEHYVDPMYRTGVWVDIFPLDGVKKSDETPFDFNDKIKSKYDIVIADTRYGTSHFRRMAKTVLKAFSRNVDVFKLARSLDEFAASTPICPENDVAMVIWGYGRRERMPYSVLERTELEFEGHTFYAPRQYDLYLQSLFGDYMTPPPENLRTAHFCSAYWKE